MQSSRSAFHHDRCLFLHLKQSIALCDYSMLVGPPGLHALLRAGTGLLGLLQGLPWGLAQSKEAKPGQAAA